MPNKEQADSSNIEIKMTCDVTAQEIAERTGGNIHTAADGFNIAVTYPHLDEKLELHMERDHRKTGEYPSTLSFPVTADGAKVVLNVRLPDTVTILRPDSVSFIATQAPDYRVESTRYPIEFFIAPDGFSYNMRPRLQSQEIARAMELLTRPVK